MSFHLTKIGMEVLIDPRRAARHLTALYARLRGRTVAVAKEIGVSRSTVKRWVAALVSDGYLCRSDIEEHRVRGNGVDRA